jgi:peptide-methionine (S)-S-oxide reductase
MFRVLLSLTFMLAVVFAAAGQTAGQSTNQVMATFAGGCFWCTEADFDKVPGVLSTTSGYIGGHVANPTYGQVSGGGTGHAEAVEIIYDPNKVSYDQLLYYYWRSVDPTVKNRQFCDVGDQYRSAIFVHDDEQRRLAEASKKKIAAELKQPVYTQVVDTGPFYKAEEYHQDFHQKNPIRYKFYRWDCGRDQRLEQLWGTRKGDS